MMNGRWLLPGVLTGLSLAIPAANALYAAKPVRLKLDEVYHEGTYAFVYDGYAKGLLKDQLLTVVRGGKPIGAFRILSVLPSITRGRFEPRGTVSKLKSTDKLEWIAEGAPKIAAIPDNLPPWRLEPNAVFGASLFDASPYRDVGGLLEASFTRTPELVTQGTFALEAATATRAIRVTPRRGWTLSYARHDAKLESTTGASMIVNTTVAGLHATLDKPASYLSRNLYPSLGAMYIATGTDTALLNETRYTGYALLRYRDKRADTWFGLGATGGTGYGKSSLSLLLGFRRPIMGKLTLTAGYASKDYLKQTFYNLRLPLESARLGLGAPLVCLRCREDALSAAVDYHIGKSKSLRVGMYDLLDMQNPVMSLRGEF